MIASVLPHGLRVRRLYPTNKARLAETTIIVAVLSLLKIPFGTALGIYTLWVLAPADSGTEYDSIADRT